MDPDQEQSDLGPHCLPVCKNRFEKFARIFSRQHKQTTFSDAVFLGALRVNTPPHYSGKVPKAYDPANILMSHTSNHHADNFCKVLYENITKPSEAVRSTNLDEQTNRLTVQMARTTH